MQIKLVSVIVNDPLEAFRFYTEVLGFVEKVYMPEMHLAIVASPDAPDGAGLLLEPNDNPVASTYQQALYEQGLPCIVLGSDDVQAEYERLSGLGVVFRGEPETTEWGTVALFEDTCGNLIQIHQG